jgi:hypothetical protein
VDSVVNGTETHIWRWDARGAPNGSYRVDVTVRSAQDSNMHEAREGFRLGADPNAFVARPGEPAGKQAAAPGLVLVVAALSGALLRRR